MLEEYNFNIVHRRGLKHGNADALSRLPCSQCGQSSHSSTAVDCSKQLAIMAEVEVHSLFERPFQQLQELQEEDPDVRYVLAAKRNNEKPPSDDVKSRSREVRSLIG